VNLKNVLSQIVAYAIKDETVIVGVIASLVIFLAAKLNIVINNADLAVILTPLVTTILVALNKKFGTTSSVKSLFVSSDTATPDAS